jgi:adenylosuccinate lyase
MISRYEQADMAALWSEEAKYGFFLDVELALLEAWEQLGTVPHGVAQQTRQIARINPERVREIEATTQHDVIAFCTSITEQVPPELGKWFHFGCTSSDVIDTALSLQVKRSLELILKEYQPVLHRLHALAVKHKRLLTIGRSHGMFAEPMSFGQKFLYAYAEFHRRYAELSAFAQFEVTGKMSGAVGNYTVVTPALEADVMQRLNISVEAVSTQIVPRDRLAKLASVIGLFAGALERFEIEIRHLHRSDVAEVAEGFAVGQKGSSTMPHKKNPIAAENLSGIARLLRSHMLVAHENILLWHERDISHSSAERLYLPDMFGLTLYALRRMNRQLQNLEVNEAMIRARAADAFQSLSSFYLHALLPQWTGPREELYALIQKAAFGAKSAADFHGAMTAATSLPLPVVTSLEDVYLKSVDATFARVAAAHPLP